jgi:branched-chain amino acid aminotransferase
MTDLTDMTCYKDGQYTALKNAGPSMLDFGFIHSDATYDVMKLVDGKIFLFDDHYDRFFASTMFYDLRTETKEEIAEIVKHLAEVNEVQTGFVWLMSWRGTPKSGNPRDLHSCPKHFVVYIKPYYNFNTDNSATVVLYTGHTRVPDDSFGQQYKNFAWQDLTLAQRHAISKGADTALLLNRDKNITEGPGFGVGFVFNGVVKVPKKDVLHSVTIKQVERICKKLSIPFEYTDINCVDSFKCDEMFLASTSGGVIAVSSYNDIRLTNNNIVKVLQNEYRLLQNSQ